jgi:hypothetical protein
MFSFLNIFFIVLDTVQRINQIHIAKPMIIPNNNPIRKPSKLANHNIP